jgi:hypothetical protein
VGWIAASCRTDDYVVRSTRCPPYTVVVLHVHGKCRRDDVKPLAGGVNKAVSELSQLPHPSGQPRHGSLDTIWRSSTSLLRVRWLTGVEYVFSGPYFPQRRAHDYLHDVGHKNSVRSITTNIPKAIIAATLTTVTEICSTSLVMSSRMSSYKILALAMGAATVPFPSAPSRGLKMP